MTNGLISGYNVMSKHTKEDILDGTVSVMVMSFFCGLGVYSHRLAYRLVGFVCIDIFGVNILHKISHVWCIKTMFTRIIALRLICTVRFSKKKSLHEELTEL